MRLLPPLDVYCPPCVTWNKIRLTSYILTSAAIRKAKEISAYVVALPTYFQPAYCNTRHALHLSLYYLFPVLSCVSFFPIAGYVLSCLKHILTPTSHKFARAEDLLLPHPLLLLPVMVTVIVVVIMVSCLYAKRETECSSSQFHHT